MAHYIECHSALADCAIICRLLQAVEEDSKPPASSSSSSAAASSSSSQPMASEAEEDSKKPCRFTLQAASLPLTRRQVVVELSPAYGRRRHPDESVEQDMEALWAQLKASVPQAFNALKFRWVGRARGQA